MRTVVTVVTMSSRHPTGPPAATKSREVPLDLPSESHNCVCRLVDHWTTQSNQQLVHKMTKSLQLATRNNRQNIANSQEVTHTNQVNQWEMANNTRGSGSISNGPDAATEQWTNVDSNARDIVQSRLYLAQANQELTSHCSWAVASGQRPSTSTRSTESDRPTSSRPKRVPRFYLALASSSLWGQPGWASTSLARHAYIQEKKHRPPCGSPEKL